MTMIIAITAAAAVLSVIYALLQTNIYRAEAVFALAEIEQQACGQFGGAASLLGVNLGGDDTVTHAIAIMKSRELSVAF